MTATHAWWLAGDAVFVLIMVIAYARFMLSTLRTTDTEGK